MIDFMFFLQLKQKRSHTWNSVSPNLKCPSPCLQGQVKLLVNKAAINELEAKKSQKWTVLLHNPPSLWISAEIK